jgi:hypothetical protein
LQSLQEQSAQQQSAREESVLPRLVQKASALEFWLPARLALAPWR